MNERIRELAEQSEVWNDDGDKCEVDLSKFAEMIVKECLTLMENCDGDLDFAIWNTKKHFGVEE